MGLLFPEEVDHFPHLRKRGFLRYREVLGQNWKKLYLANLLALLSLAPFAAGMAYALLSQSILVLIPACIIGGLTAGPGLAGMYDMILRGLRDCRDDWWHSYKKAMKQNWRASLLPGVVLCLFIGFLLFAVAMLWWAEAPISTGSVLILAFSALIGTMVFSVWWPQVVLFEQKTAIRLKNCLLFCIQNLWRMLGTAVLQLLWWVIGALFFPWTALLVPILGVWYILFLSQFLIYEQLDAAFSIEEQIGEKFPEQIPVYEEE